MSSEVQVRTGSHQSSCSVETDIDGLPLRDSSLKVDLKQILGHSPVVDEEEEGCDSGAGGSEGEADSGVLHLVPADDEYEYDCAEDEESDKRHQLLRRSSLRHMGPHPDDTSPDSDAKKAVRFADAVGLGLTDVRDLINSDEPPVIPASALKDLHVKKKRPKTRGLFNLVVAFNQPGSDFEFVNRVRRDNVALENCLVSDVDLTISGLVRVMNIAYDKRVLVRYSMDTWTSEMEVFADYVPHSHDGATDRFTFSLPLPEGFGFVPGSCVELAVCYQAGGSNYWDSNCGDNYRIDCVPCSPGHVDSDGEQTSACST